MNTIAICDRDENFLMTLSAYMNEKYKGKIEILPFTNFEKIIEYGEKRPFMAVCVSRKDMDDYFNKKYGKEDKDYKKHAQLGKIIFLKKNREEEGVFVYQPVEEITRRIIEECVKENLGEKLGLFQKKTNKNKQLFGIYSPVADPFQSIIALSMGQLLAEKKKVLMVTFEAYSGFEYFLQKNYRQDLMDLLFFLKEDSEKFIYRLSNMVETTGKLNYIPPVFSCSDLEEVDEKSWKELIDKIEEETDYDIIILNFSDRIRGVFKLLLRCDKVFTGVYDDGFLRAKVKQYEDLLIYMKQDEIINHTQKYKVHYYPDLSGQTGLLTHGEISRYVKEMLKNEL